MPNYRITEAAAETCIGFTPSQVCFFVMSDRSSRAIVTEVHIGKDTAQRHARAYGSIARCGILAGSRENGTFHVETFK
jgi:hypothetical protein